MDFKEVKELVELIDSSSLAYFELKIKDGYLKMDKSLTRNIDEAQPKVKSEEKINTVVNNEVEVSKINEDTKEKIKDIDNEEDANLVHIKAPMVGTFYSSPSPEKDAFVKEGMKVSKGQVLCIIEAMKLMNEIECENDCEIVKILIKDGEMVEYGQPLFTVRSV